MRSRQSRAYVSAPDTQNSTLGAFSIPQLEDPGIIRVIVRAMFSYALFRDILALAEDPGACVCLFTAPQTLCLHCGGHSHDRGAGPDHVYSLNLSCSFLGGAYPPARVLWTYQVAPLASAGQWSLLVRPLVQIYVTRFIRVFRTSATSHAAQKDRTTQEEC